MACPENLDTITNGCLKKMPYSNEPNEILESSNTSIVTQDKDNSNYITNEKGELVFNQYLGKSSH